MKKIAFIINPRSGVRSKSQYPRLIQKYFPENEYETVLYNTNAPNDGFYQTKKYVQEGYDAVVAIGGDGTVNEVASALLGTSVALGVVPAGSGNGLALHLKMSGQPSVALRKISKRHEMLIDGCMLNDTPFFCTAGVGYDAYIANRFAEAGRRGPVVYVGEVIFQYFDYKPQRYKLTIDGQETIERKAFLITFANAAQWGNNVIIAPNASIDDGLLDVVVMSEFPIYEAPKISLHLLARQLDKTRYVETFKCKTLKVERKNPDYVHFDGEPGMMGKKLKIKVLPKVLKVWA
ncbi:YegS/Rv2252/BmrU family lipid kinase [Microbacter margulisiae]|uniref:YegS/Rv2252/BmrU family lipid kinase n=1 Tax=Microbacter margulisiae TaxID=1350067 RepID=A0A7W5DP07_9PORP|nr:YegS/Rv2252/BmrU family lipid kinase [Microbacter margulisiae]